MLDIEAQLRTTIVFVTHDVREAVYLGDTIYISTPRPCSLKHRINHPFKKETENRKQDCKDNPDDFLQLQLKVEQTMQQLIEEGLKEVPNNPFIT